MAHFGATVTSNGPSYATGPFNCLTCLSVTLVYCLLRPNGWMDQDVTWYGGRHRPKRHCLRWGPSPPRKEAQQLLRTFRSTSTVAERLDGSGYHLIRR